MQHSSDGEERLSVSQALRRFRQMEKHNKEQQELKGQQSANRRVSGHGSRVEDKGAVGSELEASNPKSRRASTPANFESSHQSSSTKDGEVAAEMAQPSSMVANQALGKATAQLRTVTPSARSPIQADVSASPAMIAKQSESTGAAIEPQMSQLHNGLASQEEAATPSASEANSGPVERESLKPAVENAKGNLASDLPASLDAVSMADDTTPRGKEQRPISNTSLQPDARAADQATLLPEIEHHPTSSTVAEEALPPDVAAKAAGPVDAASAQTPTSPMGLALQPKKPCLPADTNASSTPNTPTRPLPGLEERNAVKSISCTSDSPVAEILQPSNQRQPNVDISLPSHSVFCPSAQLVSMPTIQNKFAAAATADTPLLPGTSAACDVASSEQLSDLRPAGPSEAGMADDTSSIANESLHDDQAGLHPEAGNAVMSAGHSKETANHEHVPQIMSSAIPPNTATRSPTATTSSSPTAGTVVPSSEVARLPPQAASEPAAAVQPAAMPLASSSEISQSDSGAQPLSQDQPSTDVNPAQDGPPSQPTGKSVQRADPNSLHIDPMDTHQQLAVPDQELPTASQVPNNEAGPAQPLLTNVTPTDSSGNASTSDFGDFADAASSQGDSSPDMAGSAAQPQRTHECAHSRSSSHACSLDAGNPKLVPPAEPSDAHSQPTEEDDSDDGFGDFNAAAPGNSASAQFQPPPYAETPSSEQTSQHLTTATTQQDQPEAAQVAQQPADRRPSSTAGAAAQESILSLQGVSFAAAVTKILSEASMPRHDALQPAEKAPLLQLTDLAPECEAISLPVSHAVGRRSQALDRLLEQLSLQDAATRQQRGFGRQFRSSRIYYGSHVRLGGPSSGADAPPQGALAAQRMNSGGLSSAHNFSSSSTLGERDWQSAGGYSIVGGGDSAALSSSSSTSALEGYQGGTSSTSLRRMLPAAKPIPEFRSLGRSISGKALPKRRLSAYGMVEVDHASVPDPLSQANCPPVEEKEASLPESTSLPPERPPSSPTPTAVSFAATQDDPFAAFASHDLISESRGTATVSGNPRSVSAPIPAMPTVIAAPGIEQCEDAADGRTSDAAPQGPFSGAEAQNALPLEGSSSIQSTTPPFMHANGLDEMGYVVPMYYCLPQASLRSALSTNSNLTPTPRLDLTTPHTLSHRRSQSLSGCLQQALEHTHSSEGQGTNAVDVVNGLASQPALVRPSQLPLPDKGSDAASADLFGEFEGIGASSSSGIAATYDAGHAPSLAAMTDTLSAHSSGTGGHQPIAAYRLQPPPRQPVTAYRLQPPPPPSRQTRDMLSDPIDVTTASSSTLAAVNVFAGQESLVSTLARRQSVAPSESDFGDFQGPLSPVARSDIIVFSPGPPAAHIAIDNATSLKSDDFGDFSAPPVGEPSKPAASLGQQHETLSALTDNAAISFVAVEP